MVSYSQHRCKNTSNRYVLHMTVRTHKSKVQPVPGIFEEQGLLRGCVCREHFQ